MKKIISIILIAIFCMTATFAYNPTSKDKQLLEKAEDTIYEIYEKRGIEKIEWLNKAINRALVKYKNNDRIVYILEEFQFFIEREILEPIEEEKYKTLELEWKSKEIELNKLRQKVVNKYINDIVWDKKIDPRCMEKYDIIDTIAREYNFPTAMIIATWKAEHSCKMENPKNGWWLFQITSQYFEPGEITDEELEKQVKWYIVFVRKKMERYIPAKKLDTSKYSLEYYNYNVYSVQYASKAYNGYSWEATSAMYTNGNLNSKLKYKKDWILTTFIKVLKRELENN